MISDEFSPQFRTMRLATACTIRDMKNLLLIAWLFLHCVVASAVPSQQDHTTLKAAVTSFVQQQTAALPGKVTFEVGEIDSRTSLRPCHDIEAFLPGGSKLIGRVTVGVRCLDPNGWRIFIPVQIRISLDLLISARPLAMGQVIHEEDLARQTVETTQSGGMTDATRVTGQVLRYSVGQGTILRETMLRAPYSVRQGQTVQLSVQGSGFNISGAGVALNNASEGDTVQIRTTSNRVISGIAGEDGSVRISP